MDPKNTLDDLAKKIIGLLPAGAAQVQQDLEASIRALLQASLSKMNLVTREEFDVQTALLQRTREKLEQLEKQMEQLSKQE